MFTITRPVSPVSPLSPAQCLALRHQTHTVEFVPDGFRPAGARPATARPGIGRRLAALLLAMSAMFGAGLVLGVADAGASPSPTPRPSVPGVTAPTAKDLSIDRGAVTAPRVVSPQAGPADDRVVAGSADPRRPQPLDPTDPERFRVDPEAFEPVRPNFDRVAEAPPVDDAAPVVDDAAPAVDDAAPVVDDATPAVVPATPDLGVPAPTDGALATAADTPPVASDEAGGIDRGRPAGSLAMTGTSAVIALVGAGLLLAGVAMAVTARSSRRRSVAAA